MNFDSPVGGHSQAEALGLGIPVKNVGFTARLGDPVNVGFGKL
jgi:hypothetical protein